MVAVATRDRCETNDGGKQAILKSCTGPCTVNLHDVVVMIQGETCATGSGGHGRICEMSTLFTDQFYYVLL